MDKLFGVCVLFIFLFRGAVFQAINAPCPTSTCDQTLVCDNGVCKYDVNVSCSANSGSCTSGSYCYQEASDQLCKFPLNGDCSSNTNGCVDGQVCDALKQNRCKYAVNTNCTLEVNSCDSTSSCINDAGDLVCKLPLGATCTPGQRQCQSAHMCDILALKCLLVINANCTGFENTCRVGTSCSATGSGKQCKLQLDQSCSQNEAGCMTDHTCDSMSTTCKLDVNVDCLGKADKCRSDTVCYVDGNTATCKFLLDANCTDSTTGCQPGQVCDSENKCKQDVFSPCDVGNDKCRSDTTCVYIPARHSAHCHLNLNANCENYTSYCVNSLICDLTGDKICKKDVGQSCNISAPVSECRASTTCQPGNGGNKCYLNLNESCQSYPMLCGIGLECDTAQGSVCKKSKGTVCTIGAGHCATGTTCATKSLATLCYINTLGSCLGFSSLCAPFHECDSSDNKCRYPPDFPCALDSTACVTTATCLNSVCKQDVGESCAMSKSCREDITQCESGSQLCKLPFGLNCTEHTTHCISPYTCDEAKLCKVPITAPCTVSQCEATTVCDSTSMTCRRPVSAGPCEAGHCVTNAVCESNKCVWGLNAPCTSGPCGMGLACDAVTFTCRVPTLLSCSGNDCVTGSVCDNGTCAIDINQVCSTTGPDYCKTDTACENGKCKWNLNANCSTSTGNCQVNATCSNELCKTIVSAPCKMSDECQIGATCDSTICAWKLMQPCAGSEPCATGTVCDNGLCRSDVTGICNLDQNCRNGTVCDNGTCVLDINQDCNPSSDKCQTKSTCDVGFNKCRWDFNQACTVPPTDYCISNTVCHSLKNLCKKIAQQPCNVDTDCLSGVCDNGTCVVDVGQNCTVGQTCTENATCDATVNQCKWDFNQPCTSNPGHCKAQTTCQSTCKKVVAASCAVNGDCQSGAVCDNFKCAWDFDSSCAVGGPCKTGTTCDKGFCKIIAGGSCNLQIDCTTGTVCDNTTCALDIDQTCSVKNDLCKKTTTCEPATNRCRWSQNANCNTSTAFCQNGFTCDTYNRICKTSLGQPCLNDSNCTSDAFCESLDSTGKCVIQEGRPCTSGEFCLTNASCRKNKVDKRTCKCEEGYTFNREERKCSGEAALPMLAVMLAGCLLAIWLGNPVA